jgi:polygalacturonase
MKFLLLIPFLMSVTVWQQDLRAQSSEVKYSWANLPKAERPVFKADTFDITAFGAKSDGKTLNTQSINNAIKTCSTKGGGVVRVPGGLWITGPVVLQNNVNLFISGTAILQFTDDKDQYQLTEGYYEGKKAIRNQAPISGSDLVNIAITGEGIVDGRGDVWRAMGKDRLSEPDWRKLLSTGGEVSEDGKMWYPSKSYAKAAQLKNALQANQSRTLEDYRQFKDFFRPNLLVLTNCKKVLLQNTTFQNSPAWCLHTLLCEDLTFEGVRIRNESIAQNGDGLDIESCKNVLVDRCVLDAGDDGICIKSGKDEEGRERGKACQNVLVKNCVVYKGHGGFVIGSEMSGGAHDIFVTDCSFIGTDNGLRFKTVRGRGGIVENIYIRNITMRDIIHDAILFDMYYFTQTPSLAQSNGKVDIPEVNEGTPRFRNLFISDLVCDGADRAMLIRGLPEMLISNIQLKNIFVRSRKGAEISDAQNILLENITLNCQVGKPLVLVENSNGIRMDKLLPLAKTDLLINVSGDRSAGISLRNTDLSLAGTVADFTYGASKNALSVLK